MKDKIGIVIGIGIIAAVLVTFLFYLQNAGNIEIGELFMIIIVLILVISSSYLVWDRLKNLKAGLPAQDERSKSLGFKAGYYGFIAAIWSAVGSNMASIMIFDQELRGGLVTAAVVLVSGLVFIISYLYLTWKGN